MLGVRSDVQDTGFVASNKNSFLWLDHWCSYRYIIHTAGFSYSAGLKYKLACGSVVFKFKSVYTEFWEPALKPDVHFIELAEEEDKFHEHNVPKMREVLRHLEEQYGGEQPPVAVEGRRFALHQLTKDSLSCYWYKALERYADLYFASPPASK